MFTYHWIKLIISRINWNYKPYDLSGLFAQYTIPDYVACEQALCLGKKIARLRLCNYRKKRRSRRLARETFQHLYPLVMKKKQITATQRFFHRLPRHKIWTYRTPLGLWKPQYRTLKQKLPQHRTKNNPIPQYRKPLRPPPPPRFVWFVFLTAMGQSTMAW